MERKLRLAAPAAGGAFVLSLLIAMVAGVPFGVALLRSLMAGLSFFAIAFGIVVLVESFLPDLIIGSSTGDQADQDDLVEDGDGGAGTASSPADAGEAFDDDAAADRSESESSTEAAGKDPAVGNRLDIVVEDEDDDDASEDLVEEVQESAADDEGEIMTAAISEEQDGTSVEIDDTMLDEMPDIGSFAGSFVSSEFGDSENDETGASAGAAPSGTGRQKVGDPRKGFDNAEIAKALQTMLGRDDGA
jgi:hypothetical protein